MKVTRFNAKNGTGGVTDAGQLSKLSSVLNGLEQGASAMRRRARQLMRAVRSGTYEVDPLKLSRRMIGDTVASV
jgi:anti-sigma28 factor (negative regulator of flagellin synthesis)